MRAAGTVVITVATIGTAVARWTARAAGHVTAGRAAPAASDPHSRAAPAGPAATDKGLVSAKADPAPKVAARALPARDRRRFRPRNRVADHPQSAREHGAPAILAMVGAQFVGLADA